MSTYASIGDYMKQHCGGYWGYVYTGNMLLSKRIGLKSKRRIEMATAQLDGRLLEFELYAGTRKVVDGTKIRFCLKRGQTLYVTRNTAANRLVFQKGLTPFETKPSQHKIP